MSLSSWLRSWNRSLAGTPGRLATAPRQRHPFAPRLEALEDRWLPSTLTVTTAADSSTSRIVGSLRYEIGVAQSGDTIVFDKSLKGQTITLSGQELLLDKNLTIQGLGAGSLAISGGNQSRVFEVVSGTTVTLSGMTIENGDGFASNSGNELWGGSFEDGGGILNEGTLTLSGDTLTGNNSYQDGGAIANEYGTTLTVTGSTVSSNHAYADGGAIANEFGATLTVTGSTVSSNEAATDGGGIYNGGTLTVLSSTVSSNDATDGGGIYNSATLTVLSSTVTDNTPDDLSNFGVWKHQKSNVGTIDR